MNKTNIVMLAYTNYSTDSRVKREAESLADAGFNVDFITLRRPKEPKIETINEVNIYHLNQIRYRGSSNIKYISSYLIFFIKSSWKILHLHIIKKYKLIHINNMPDFMVFTASIPKLLGAKLILDIHDNMPELFSSKFKLPPNNLLIRFLKLQELLSAKFVDAIIAVHQIQKELLIKHGIPRDKINVVMNVSDNKIFYPRNKEKTDEFILVYHGTIAKRHGCDTLIKAINILKDKIQNLKLEIFGEGDALNYAIILSNQLNLKDYIHFSDGFVPLNELPNLLSTADVGIVPNIKDIYTDIMLPVKLLEYISLKIPIIASRTKTVEYYFDDSQVRYFESGSPKSLADAILDLYKNPLKRSSMIENASKFEKIYNWEKQKIVYQDLVRRLLS